MKPTGENIWAGTAFNPDDGKRYSGKMTLSGDRLVTAGCVFGGLICKVVRLDASQMNGGRAPWVRSGPIAGAGLGNGFPASR